MNNNKHYRLLCLALSFWLFVCAACPGALALEISQTESTTPTETQVPVTVPTQVTEAETVALPEETEAIPETTVPILPAVTEETDPMETQATEPYETVAPSEVETLLAEEDEWLFTLTPPSVPANPAVPEEPESTGFAQLVAESRLELLLVALVFAGFGIGTCWFGKHLGGLKFLLRFYGVRTEGAVSRVDRDAWNRAHRCFVSYRLENGRMIESQWPVLQHIVRMKKMRGKTCTVYYNPQNPKEYLCTAFPLDNFLGTVTVVMGALLLVAAIAVICCVIFV